ncbi:ATP-binding protein [Streptomyces albogriseolus]|uniref:ATP-binding protein n=1 Tax=Streptomyces albogriseolus TaxID=1887 RepID=UPI0037B9BA09
MSWAIPPGWQPAVQRGDRYRDRWTDLEAVRGEERLICEAKGRTKDKGINADMAYGQLLRRMTSQDAGIPYALVVPWTPALTSPTAPPAALTDDRRGGVAPGEQGCGRGIFGGMTPSPRTKRRSALPLPLADQTVLSFRFTPSPRGARLARRLACCQMDAWGWHHGTPAHDAVELIVAELTNNAVTHGRVPGRDAELRLSREDGGRVRVEVSDARGERLPETRDAGTGEEGGRGLLLVAALAKEWGTAPRPGAPGKTVWAVVPAEPVRG